MNAPLASAEPSYAAERPAAISRKLEWQYIVDDLSELSEVEVEQEHWETRYDSDAFKFTRPLALTAIGNTLGFWKPEQLGIELEHDIDEVSLAGGPPRLADRNIRRDIANRVTTLDPIRIQRMDASPVSHRMFDRPRYPQMRAVESFRI